MADRLAARTRLEPGEHSIDRVTPRQNGNVWLLDWSIRLSDGRMVTKRSQGPTKGEAKRRAKATATELLTTGGGASLKTTSFMSDYLDQVSKPAIEKAPLRKNSRTRYLIALEQLAGDCTGHTHVESMKKHSIASGTRFRALEKCLQEIAALHGAESARQARTVLSKYVIQQLIRDQIIDGNPMGGMSIDLQTQAKPFASKSGVQALTRGEYNAVLEYLLNLDPAEGQTKPARGRWTIEDRIAKRRNMIDLTLLQATTGLRVTEANSLIWNLIETGDDGTIHVNVTKQISKTHRARRVPILDARVSERILTRQNSAPNGGFVIGSPADPLNQWDPNNCRKMAAEFYVEMADALDIELLTTARTHVWRATLNSLLRDEVSEVDRSAFFGHDIKVNRASYTDLADTSGMVTAARRLRAL